MTASLSPVDSPRDRFIGFSFLVALLLIAGTTASVVAYRIKSREWTIRAELDQTYRLLTKNTHEPKILVPQSEVPKTPLEQFLQAYEFNQFARGFGLLKTLTTLPKENSKSVMDFLDTLEGSAAGTIVRNTQDMIDSEKLVDLKDASADVRRAASKFNIAESRRLERELYLYAGSQGILIRSTTSS